MGKNKVTPEVFNQVKSMANRGLRQVEIAKIIGTSNATVHGIVHSETIEQYFQKTQLSTRLKRAKNAQAERMHLTKNKLVEDLRNDADKYNVALRFTQPTNQDLMIQIMDLKGASDRLETALRNLAEDFKGAADKKAHIVYDPSSENIGAPTQGMKELINNQNNQVTEVYKRGNKLGRGMFGRR